MSDINKFTTKEVLNKVLLDSSGNAVNAFSHTTQEAFNAALDDDNSRLNVNLVGGTIGGDVTINGDLTVNGDGVGAYDEIINGQLEVRGDATDSATGMTGFLTLSTAFTDINATDQLGRINFQAPLEAGGTDAILAGASIYGIAEATFANNNNSTGIAFATATSSAPIERMRITSTGNVGIGIDAPLSQLHVKNTYSANYSANGEPSRHGITILNNADTGTYATPHAGILFMSGSSGTGRTSVGGVRSGDGLADLVFGSGTAGGSVTERMRISSAGNVGIGTASPDNKLHVNGGHLEVSNGGNTNVIINSALGSDGSVYFREGGGMKARVYNDASADALVLTDGADTTTLTLAGTNATFAQKIGVGASPQSFPDKNVTIEGTSAGLVLRDSTGDNQATQWGTLFTSNNNVRMMYDDSGTFQVGNADNYQGTNYEINLRIDANSRISLSNNDSGTSNTVFGKLAGDDLASGGNYNSLFGEDAGHAITTGDGNTVMGHTAGDAITTTSDCTLIGQYAGSGINNADANGSTAVGHTALWKNTSGRYNTAIGFQSLAQNLTGDSITSLGYQALTATLANDNTGIGYLAGNTITTGTSNTLLGSDADVSASGSTNQIVIGQGATGVADNSVTLGNASVTDVYMASDKSATAHAGKLSILRVGTATAFNINLTGSGINLNSPAGYAPLNLFVNSVNLLKVKNTGEVHSTWKTGTAAGAGIDAVSPTIMVGNYNSEIVTTIFIDIGAGLIISDDGAGEVIGEDGVAAAYLTRITTAVNGIIYGGEIICLEVPTTGDPDINVVANASATLAQEAAGEGEHVLANCGVHTLGLKTEFTIPAGSNVNDYIYLTHGGTTAGTYDAGKFLLRFYGASVTGL
jgi:hypothetical protein